MLDLRAPPDQRETAARAGTRRDGKDSLNTNNANRHTRKKQTATPCSECRHYEAKRPGKPKDRAVTWARRWSGCYLAVHRNPDWNCPHFRKRGERSDLPHNDVIRRRLERAHRAGALPEAAFRWAMSYLTATRRRGFTPTDIERAVMRRILSEHAGEDGRS